jgi:uncharacterized damage-inducible protein DinB
MTRTLMTDAFSHHVWATLLVLDTCDRLTADQLETEVEGTYGSIIDTLRHLVAADSSYLFVLTGGGVPAIDETEMSIGELRGVMERNGEVWASLPLEDMNPDTVLVGRRDDGSESHAAGVRLAQALHHGTDHRSQVCTALTTIGISPPAIDVWDFAWHEGRLVEIPPSG